MTIIGMVILRRTGSVFLLLAYLISTSGISILHHFCSASQHNDIILYPGILTDRTTCCCAETIESSCSVNQADDMDHNPVRFEVLDDGCCKTVITKLRLETKVRVTSTGQVSSDLKVICLPSGEASVRIAESRESMGFFRPRWHSPPDLSGSELVHYLHQIKIPSPLTLV